MGLDLSIGVGGKECVSGEVMRTAFYMKDCGMCIVHNRAWTRDKTKAMSSVGVLGLRLGLVLTLSEALVHLYPSTNNEPSYSLSGAIPSPDSI